MALTGGIRKIRLQHSNAPNYGGSLSASTITADRIYSSSDSLIPGNDREYATRYFILNALTSTVTGSSSFWTRRFNVSPSYYIVYPSSNDRIALGGFVSSDYSLSVSGDSFYQGNIMLSGGYFSVGSSSGISSGFYSQNLSNVILSGGIAVGIENVAISSITSGLVMSEIFSSSTSNLQNQITSDSSSISTLSSNMNSYTLSSVFVSTTASLTGANIWSSTGNSIWPSNTAFNVGIGLISPTASSILHISSNQKPLIVQQNVSGSFFNGIEFLDYSGLIDASLKLNQSTGEFRLFTKNGGYFPTFYAQGSEAMRITTDGKLAIGTTGASEILSASGNASFSGSITSLGNATITGNLTVGNNLGSRLTLTSFGIFLPGTIMSTNNGAVYSSSGNYAVYMNNSFHAGANQICGKIDAYNFDNPAVNPILRIGHDAKNIDFGTNSQAVPRMRISDSGNVTIGNNALTSSERLLVSGNVSITGGNLTLSGNLITQNQSLSSQYAGVQIGTYGTISETNSGLAYITGNSIRSSSASINSVVKTSVDNGHFMRMRYDRGITFHTGLTGAVGTQYADSAQNRLTIKSNGDTGIGNITNEVTLQGSVLTVLTGGFVGINTISPAQVLSVNGNASITGVLSTTGGMAGLTGGLNVRGDGTNSPISIYSGAGGQIFSIRNNGIWDVGAGTLDFTSGYTFNTSNTQRLAVQSNGNVAVGNITATERLSVTGNLSLSGGVIKAPLSNNSVTANIFQSGQSVTYQKGANYIIAYNDAGTMKYRYLVLTGTDAVWNYSTTAP